MYVGQIILLLMLASLLAGASFAIVAAFRIEPEGRAVWTAGATGAVIAAVVLLLVSTRSLSFGVDTRAYAALFEAWCAGQELPDQGPSYDAAIYLLNFGMLGACTPVLLPLSWAVLVLGLILLAPEKRAHKAAFLGLLLFSLVGFELLTNAMRQSLSVGVALIAVALYSRTKAGSALAAAVAALLHNSAALVLAAAWGATFRWHWFLLGFLAVTLVIVVSLVTGNALILLEPLLYEIEKYLGHESDEIWIRLLAASCVLVALGAPLLAASGKQGLQAIWTHPNYQVALRLAFTCIPFLAIPWFGYRYIYGVYPIVLWLSLLVGADVQPRSFGWQFGWTWAGNALILVGWSQGASYMRLIPFYA